MKYINKIIVLLAAVFLGLVSMSCLKDEGLDKYDPTKNGNDNIKLSLVLPGMERPGTYAIDAIRQNQITTLDVLVFNVVGGEEIFDYQLFVDSDDIEELTTTGYRKVVNVSLQLPPAGQLVRIVTLANIADFVPDNIVPGTKREDVLEAIKFDLPDGRWLADDHNNYDPIPMWGMSDKVELDPDRDLEAIQMVRALAKVDLYVNRQNETYAYGISNFRIDNIYIMNAAGQGHIAPTDDAYIESEKRVTKPTVPQPQVSVTDPAPIVMNGANILINSIFLAEIYKLQPGDEDKATYFILECTFEGEKTFYRIDFINYFNDEKIIMDIMRNYRYAFNISNVHRKGYPTMDAAKAGMSSNDYLDIELGVTNESVHTDGNYYLTTSIDVMRTMYLDAYPNNRIEIYTDDPQGWTAEITESWIDVTSPLSGGQGPGFITFDLAATTLSREGKIIVRTEQITKEILILHSYCNVIPAEYLGYELEVCLIEQPFGHAWFHYANTEHRYYRSQMEPPSPEVYQYDVPLEYSCANLDWGHHNDWRLPTEKEVRQIMRYANTQDKETQLFDYRNGTNLWFMTASSTMAYPIAGGDFSNPFSYSSYGSAYESYHLHQAHALWVLSGEFDGLVVPDWSTNYNYDYYNRYRDKGDASYSTTYNRDRYGNKRSGARCVRGGEPYKSHLIKAADTGLGYDIYMARHDLGTPTNYESVTTDYFAYNNLSNGDYTGTNKLDPVHRNSCEALNLKDGTDGFKDWRLPTITELKAIFDYIGSDQMKMLQYNFHVLLMTYHYYNSYYYYIQYPEQYPNNPWGDIHVYHYWYSSGYISSTPATKIPTVPEPEFMEMMYPTIEPQHFVQAVGYQTSYSAGNLINPPQPEVFEIFKSTYGSAYKYQNESPDNHYHQYSLTARHFARCVRS